MRVVSMLAAGLLVFAVSIGCGRTRTVTTSPATGSMTLHFDHTAGGAPLAVSGSTFQGADGAGNDFSVTTLRYFVSDLRLRRTDGTTFGVDDYHYRDAALLSTRDYTIAGVPSGTYDRLIFTFGLDERWNVTNNEIASDHRVSGMEWPADWGGGWHYMILEGMHSSGGSIAYRTHTGRRFIASAGDPSGQGPDTVAHPHDFQVHLVFPSPVAIDGDAWDATVRMELNGWYDDPSISLASWFPTGAEGIMVNLAAQDLLRQNGPDCFTVDAAVRH